MTGTLYIVATPLGNLEDITLRAIRILKEEVDTVLAEDTRRTRPLLNHLGVKKKVISYFEYSKGKKDDEIIRRLLDGENYALVTDAGTPGLSDPGSKLVCRARAEGIDVFPIPGPTALGCALSVSGLPTEPLHFWGFLPMTGSKRKKIYARILELEGAHCFYMSPHKLLKYMEEWAEFFGDYYVFVGKEMTKKFETYFFGPYTKVMEEIREHHLGGEYTVLLSSRLLIKDLKL